ncbi:hypothetical protein AWV79_36920 [Cupriavidus sp. UYMMa02A]|nr:hypothetical protein AWV79_36920 [Cupriavidus sp. UYMMa02A]
MPFSLRFSPHDIYPDALEARLAELHEIAEDVQRAQERRWRKHGTLLSQGIPSQGDPYTRTECALSLTADSAWPDSSSCSECVRAST